MNKIASSYFRFFSRAMIRMAIYVAVFFQQHKTHPQILFLFSSLQTPVGQGKVALQFGLFKIYLLCRRIFFFYIQGLSGDMMIFINIQVLSWDIMNSLINWDIMIFINIQGLSGDIMIFINVQGLSWDIMNSLKFRV